MSEDMKKYHRFTKKTAKLKDVLALIRGSCYSNYDEGGTIIICPECEEWTHVKFNAHSCLLDLLGDLTVESIDAEEDEIMLWIKTDDYNWFCVTREEGDGENADQ